MSKYIIKIKSKSYNHNIQCFFKSNNIKYEYLNDIDVYIISTNQKCAKCIESLPYVKDIGEDVVIPPDEMPKPKPPTPPYNPDPIEPSDENTQKSDGDWGAYAIEADLYWKQGITGKDISVAILDRGIYDHKDLTIKDRVFIGTAKEPKSINGTLVAGVIGAKPKSEYITGIAYNCDLYDVNIADEDGTVTLSNLLKGLEWCADNKILIVNIDYGILPDKLSKADRQTIKDSCEKFSSYPYYLLLSAGTGNVNIDTVEIPAAYIFGVGAVDKEYIRWVDKENSKIGSSYSKWLDLHSISYVAPGVDITTTTIDNNYVTVSSTDIASAMLSGLFALYLNNKPNVTPNYIRADFNEYAMRLPRDSEGENVEYGWGLIKAPTDIL